MGKHIGIDISYWQGNIDFSKVKKSGVEFVILRSGYSTTTDLKFYEYVEQCNAVNLPILGVYHFSYALNTNDVVKEAKYCLEQVKKAGLGKETIVFFDFEYDTVNKAKNNGVNLGYSECNSHTKTFCEYIETQGYKAGIYSNIDYYNNMYNKSLIEKYVFWLADYTGDPDYKCLFHQYSSKGKVNGINCDVDMDYFYGDITQERKDTLSSVTSDDNPISNQVSILIDIAKNEIGYLEKASNYGLDEKTKNAGHNNYTKYWRDIADWGMGDYQAQYWCAAFVYWCFVKAFGLDDVKKLLYHAPYIYCPTAYNLFKNNKRLYSYPSIGDVVLFMKSSGEYGHTGIVYSIDDTYFYTIEGNTSSTDGVVDNGGAVAYKKYSIASSVNYGHKFCRPDYSIVSNTSNNNSSNINGNDTNSMDNGTTLSKETKWIGVVSATSLNVRKWAGISNDLCSFSPLKKNTTINICDELKDKYGNVWYYIEYNGKYGFVASEYVLRISKSELNKEPKKDGKVIASSLNVRKWAGTENSLCSFSPLGNGTVVQICDTIKDKDGKEWFYIKFENKYGFVSSDYIE